MKKMKKMMTLLAVAGLGLALAPAAQAADVTWSADADTNWDETTLNWDNGASTFTDGDKAIFDGVVSGTVNLTADRTPEAVFDGVTVSGANNYEFTGSGITGGTGLTWPGTNTLTLSNSGNTYSGGTFFGINGTKNDGTIVATSADSLGAGDVFNADSNVNDGNPTLRLQNNASTTWVNNFKKLGSAKDGRFFTIDVGGGGAPGTTHTFGNLTETGGGFLQPTFTGSEGYNLNVGAISGNHQVNITTKMDGELTIASVNGPGSSRSMSFRGNGLGESITVIGDVLLAAPMTLSHAPLTIGNGVDLTVDGIFQVRNSRIDDSTFTSSSTGTMLFDIIGAGTGEESAEILGVGAADTLIVNGKFLFDVTAADEAVDTTWQVVGTDIESKTYHNDFTVTGATSGGGAAGSRVWTFAGVGEYIFFEFSEATGVLEVVYTPPPAGTVIMLK
jgi:hypothetical protein